MHVIASFYNFEIQLNRNCLIMYILYLIAAIFSIYFIKNLRYFQILPWYG